MATVLRPFTSLFLLLILLVPAVLADDYKTPEKVLAKMEANLLKIQNRKVRFRAEATGAITAAFEGDLIFKKGSVIEYRTAGKFLGKDHRLFLLSDGVKLRGGNEVKPFEMAMPAELRSALLIGMSRMGLMHNLARLAGNQAPERADGTVFKWLEVQAPKFAKDHAPDTPQANAELKQKDKKLLVVFYKLGVEGNKNAGDVELWIDTKTNLPSYRQMTVHFPQGDMFVTEKYTWEKL